MDVEVPAPRMTRIVFGQGELMNCGAVRFRTRSAGATARSNGGCAFLVERVARLDRCGADEGSRVSIGSAVEDY